MGRAAETAPGGSGPCEESALRRRRRWAARGAGAPAGAGKPAARATAGAPRPWGRAVQPRGHVEVDVVEAGALTDAELLGAAPGGGRGAPRARPAVAPLVASALLLAIGAALWWSRRAEISSVTSRGFFEVGAPDLVSKDGETLIYHSLESAGVAYSTIRYGATCANWDSISLQEHSYEPSVASCAHTCSQASMCTGFIFKPKSCAADEEFGQGSCFLYSNYCDETGDQCWDLYMLDTIQPPTPPDATTPLPPTSPPEPTPLPTPATPLPTPAPPTTPEPMTPEPTPATPQPTFAELLTMAPEPTLSPTVAPTKAPVTPVDADAGSVEPASPPSATTLLRAAQAGDDVVYLVDVSGISQGDNLTIETPEHSETHAVQSVNLRAVTLDSSMEHSVPVGSTVRQASPPTPSPTPPPEADPSPSPPPDADVASAERQRSSPRKSFPWFTWLLLLLAVIVLAFLSLNFFGYTYSSDSCSRLVGDLKGRLDGCFGSSSARKIKDLGRQDMIEKVFHRFDRDGDSRLSSDELMLFASCLPHDPFVGTKREWDDYYNEGNGSGHVNLERFRKLVDTRDHEGDPVLSLYQTDEDLRRLLEMHSPDFRRYLVSSVFDIFDVDRDGILSKEELRVFAVSVPEEPFEGTVEHWEEFYADVIGEDGLVDLEKFQELVDDRHTDAPLHNSDVELAQMIASHMAVTPRDLSLPMDVVRREQMIAVLFDMFDMDRDGILSKEELMYFAQNLPNDPWEGPQEEFDDMYQNYVHEIGEPVDLERFTLLLGSDFDENPLELTDDEIMHMVRPDRTEHGGEGDSEYTEGLDHTVTPRGSPTR